MPSRLLKASNNGSDLPAIEALAARPVALDGKPGRDSKSQAEVHC